MTAVAGIDLKIEAGEFFALLGPSGCGQDHDTADDRWLLGADERFDPVGWHRPRRHAGAPAASPYLPGGAYPMWTPPSRSAGSLGGPVAMKLSASDLRHKSDIGAVLLGVDGPAAVRSAFATLRALPGHDTTPVLVESMAVPGVELVVAVSRHGVVPVLVVGLGGVWVELLDDALLIPLPVEPRMIPERIAALRAAPLLTGARGHPASTWMRSAGSPPMSPTWPWPKAWRSSSSTRWWRD